MAYNSNQEGYHYREGYASSNPKSLNRKSKMDFLSSKWPKAFMATVTIQAIICLAFEMYASSLLSSPIGSVTHTLN